MPKYSVDKDKCIGCGLCAGIAEAVFAIGDDGFAGCIYEDELDENLVPQAEEAREQCPTQAIVKE